MAFEIKRNLYEILPIQLKQVLCLVPFSWLAGKSYRITYRRGDWFDRASHDELRQYQEHRLGVVLQFAVEQIPAYRCLQSIVMKKKPFEAIKEFPLLDKENFQKNIKHYLPKDFYRLPHYEATTGGTSGNQLKIYLDDHSQSIEMGFVHRFWKRMNYLPQYRKATFRGVTFPKLPENVFWQYNPIYNEIQFSPFHMNEKNLHYYIEELIRFRPCYLHGYPSAIDTLSEYILRKDLLSDLPPVNAAFLASEGCTQMQRERIERAFRTRVFSWYGHTERLIFGGECEKNNTYHHFPDYGILEIIDDEGNSCIKEGERGELVGTGINNFCMPLIRYRTGDYVTRLDSNCDCGRHWDRFTDVEGRWRQDMIIGKNMSRIPIAALNMHGPLFERVVRYQYYQDTIGFCTLRVVVAPDFSDKDRRSIETAYQEKVGSEVIFSVKIVPDILLTHRGKVKVLDSRLMKC